MATNIGLLPYGLLQDGKLGYYTDDITGKPRASVLEVVDSIASLPVASADNFPGRQAFALDTSLIYVFSTDPSNRWIAIEGIPADVGIADEFVSGTGWRPASSPTPETGRLFYATVDGDGIVQEIVYVWDGTAWQPVGGRYASVRRTQTYTGDGIETSFSMGTTGPVQSSYVDVIIDGVMQYPNPSGDYSIVGTNVVFNSAPPVNTKILIKAVENTGEGLAPNTQIETVTYTAPVNASYTNFDLGIAGADPAGIFVTVNRELMINGIDYNVSQQDQSISTLTRSGTTATATIASTTDLSIGFSLEISGVENDTNWNGTYEVTAVTSGTTFEFTVPNTLNAVANGSNMVFTPPFQNDRIIFTTPLVDNDDIQFRAFRGIVTAPSVGEANTLASLGSGVDLSAGKVGDVLQLKSLKAGPNVDIVDSSNEVTISVTSVAAFEDRVGVNSNSYVVNSGESYVGVRNTTYPGGVTINLSGIASGVANSGRRITITDESGGAATNNITVQTGGPTISSTVDTSYTIDRNFGSVTMVFDGSAWYITSEV